MTPLETKYIQVHVLDPMQGRFVAQWVVGQDIPVEKYEQFVDPKTNDLYAITYYDAGEPRTMVIPRDRWDQASAQFGD